MHRFANPTRFLRLSGQLLPWAGGLTVVLIAVGLYLGLLVAPPDYQQGDAMRIMYVHVPAAWMALFIYSVMAGLSAVGLIWRHPIAHLAAKSCGPLGAGFTLIALVSGSLWGKPMWGTWWVWDARLTSVLILFFLYLGYIAIWRSFDDREKASRAAAILALVGFVNVPIIKFSVDWWNTLHQPASVLRMGGPSIDGSMLAPLLIMAVGFTTYFMTVVLWRIRTEIIERKIRARLRARGAANA